MALQTESGDDCLNGVAALITDDANETTARAGRKAAPSRQARQAKAAAAPCPDKDGLYKRSSAMLSRNGVRRHAFEDADGSLSIAWSKSPAKDMLVRPRTLAELPWLRAGPTAVACAARCSAPLRRWRRAR